MKISIEFYASLMKYLPPGNSRFRREVRVDDGMRLKPLIEKYNIPADQAHIVLVNGHFVNVDDREEHVLNENDVVSIWPPVAGG